MSNPQCPKCSSEFLVIERRPDGNARCSTCGWDDKYSLCFDKPTETNTGWPHEKELHKQIAELKAQLAEANAVAEFYGNKNHWNRKVNGWRHDMIEQDLDDETLTDFEGRFSGKRARQYLEKWGVKL